MDTADDPNAVTALAEPGIGTLRPADAGTVLLEPTRAGSTRSALHRALDLWGFARSSKVQLLALAITGAFVVLEARYNIDLLNTLTNPDSSRELVQSLSERGKLLASIGITWACGRFLLERIVPAVLAIVLLAAIATGVYFGLDYTYTQVIHDLPAAVKLQGFRLFSYRQDLLTGRLFDPDIPLPKDDPVAGRIIMGAFPIVLLDERFMLPARDIVERKANDKIRFVLKDAEAAWPDYANQMRELQDGWRGFIDGSKQAAPYGSEGAAEFKKKSGGLEPDASLSLPQFVDMLRKSSHPKGEALREGEAREIARRPNGSVVRAGEIPKFLDHKQYLGWFESQAKDARDQAIPTEQTVERLAGIQDMNSAIFLPPMAMIASLTSAITNGLTFVLLAASTLALQFSATPVRRFGLAVKRFGALIMLALFALLLLATPTYVFKSGPLQELEEKMHRQIGFAGRVWSRLSNVQTLLLHAPPS